MSVNIKSTIIKLTNIQKVFKVRSQDVGVLENINLEIKENDFNIIFGPSGCGKSTLLHIILGLEAPTSGKISFLGRNIYDYSEDDRSEFRKQHIGMIYQQPNWIKSLSVIENVAFAASISGKNKLVANQQAKSMLELVGMAAWADYFPTELSSGQQQKVSLARALITNPQIIIADEPTGNLDYKSGTDLMNLFGDLVKQGKTVIMVTHDINMIDYSNVVIQIFDGRIVKVHNLKPGKSSQVKKAILETIYQDKSRTTNPIITSSQLAANPKPLSLAQKFTHLKNSLRYSWSSTTQVFSFLLVLVAFLVQQLFDQLSKFRLLPKLFSRSLSTVSQFFIVRVLPIVEPIRTQAISRVDLISLSLQNMKVKKTRTLITVGGMAIGVGLIVFLVSVGYGLERMVVSRVARLEEMRHIDVSPAISTNIRINDQSLASLNSIINVNKVLPVIGVVGKVNFQNSITDVVVYGVMADYLNESAIKPIFGKVFAENKLNNKVETSTNPDVGSGSVAGSFHFDNVSYLAQIGSVEYTIEPDKFIRVRTAPFSRSPIVGYTRRIEGGSVAQEVLGKSYPDTEAGDVGQDTQGEKLGLWLKATVPLWEKQTCETTDPNCDENNYVPLTDETGNQVQKSGYFAEVNLSVDRNPTFGSVLGVTTSEPDSSSIGMIDIAALEATPATDNTKKVTLSTDTSHEVIVNTSLLKVLNIPQNQSIGKTINLSFVVTGELSDDKNKIVSEPATYTIVGVTGDSKSPVAHVPIADIKSMGVSNYSLVKVVTATTKDLPFIRKQIEAFGFKTASVADTVSQIEQLFSSLKLILGIVGVVALSVAALGMFNTLTVSLMERTREVGMMKAIGMKSQEVRDLFLTESMIMGLFGGMGGLLMGLIAGKLTSLLLSAIALAKGVGTVDVTFIPMPFVIFIVTVSIIVGILTGIYPSRRATKISALNALRYE
ncbi:MAG: ATP-binding cassette domain-containing protein [Candidatus Shapirobacteria bacterium]